jgi:type IV secretory pathway TraG/TraD family ATPase VirD4
LNTANLNALIYTWTHGTKGLVLLYAIIAVFSLAGLKRGRASLRQYIAWPVTTLATLVVVGLATQFLLWVLEKFAGLTFGGNPLILPLVLYMFGGFLGGLYWAKRGQPLASIERRGAMVFDGGQAQAATSKLRNKARRLPPAQMPLTVAGVAVPFEDEFKHFKFLGTTGTGKSTVMRELLHAALYRGDRAVIADPDGGYLARFYDPKRGDVILNPFDARSAKWNLFAELRNAYDVDELAQAFIPDRGSDPTWTNFARTLFSAVTAQAQVAGIDDIGELYRLLVAASKDELQVLVTGTPAAPFLEAGSDKLFQGARSTVTAAVKSLDFVRAQQTPLFSVREWVKSGRGVLFLPYQADQISALKAIISIWMRLAIFQTMSLGEGDHRLWFAVDELDALGAINGLPDALTRLRKFGGRCVLGLQSIAQASTNYGQGVAQSLIENCGNTLILRCSASEGGGTARYASKLIGEREVVRLVRSVSRSSGAKFGDGRDTEGHSEQTATELAVMAAEIEQLADRTGFLKFASQPGWMRVAFPVYETEKVTVAFAPRG